MSREGAEWGAACKKVGLLVGSVRKTMLAHSSIENVGIVVVGFGSGMVFVAANYPVLASIAFLAGVYHLLNHSLYKTLLFFGVGAVESQTGTCDLDRLRPPCEEIGLSGDQTGRLLVRRSTGGNASRTL
jgi:NADH:ubiquinone oxidoreductase subunit 5 (subunit L)/multisubunit Na+/H+ antiporter MnhA subunit